MTTTVTKELIEAGRSDAGGWTREQLALIGVSWPPPKDWKRAAIGKQITEGSASRFIAIRSERGRTKKPPLCAHDALPTNGEVARARRLRASGQGSGA